VGSLVAVFLNEPFVFSQQFTQMHLERECQL
jgi:hypothetical protein